MNSICFIILTKKKQQQGMQNEQSIERVCINYEI